MSEAIVSTVVETIRGLLIEEAKFLSGVTNEVQELSRELIRMQCFLRDADTRDHKDKTVQNFLKEIKRLSYRAEDIVETFAVQVASKRGKGLKKVLKRFASIICEGNSLHNLGLEIANVKTDISRLITSLQTYDIKAISEGESPSGAFDENQRWARQTYAHEVEEYFVGMEVDIKKLVSHVAAEDKHHRPIISIWGMGGLGKTTIARKVYNHRDVRGRFDRFAWVCITQQPQIKGILQDILTHLSPEKKEEVKHMEDRVLVEELYRVQKEINCLVVLDDIWNMHDWEKLVHAFPTAEEGGSKILLTTRTKEVAKIGLVYELRYLKEEESWELLRKIAFSRKGVEGLKVEPDLEAVGIEMVRKCGGLPLAISVLGGMLKDKGSLRDWKNVNKSIDLYLCKGEGNEEGSDGGAIAQVLSLSYNVLPYHLKPCFLYLGNFCEDDNIDVEQLYLLWIAEGMIISENRKNGETLVDVAERYLNELRQRCMIQVEVNDFSTFGRFKSCRLHDVMREFCLKKGREEEFTGVIDVRGIEKPSLDSFSLINKATYRLIIHINGNVEAPANPNSVLEDYKQLRSFVICNTNFWNGGCSIIWPVGIVNYKNFKSLRVLNFEGYGFLSLKLPKGLEEQIHLRFLSFKDCLLDELPSSIVKLPFLQTLDLRVLYDLTVPDFGKMKRLRYLYLPDSVIAEKKVQLNGLSELEILDGIIESSAYEIADFRELSNLRSLRAHVTDNESLSAIIDHLIKNGQNLQETRLIVRYPVSFSSEQGASALLRKILRCGTLHILIFHGVKISQLPPYEEHFLQGLVDLQLRGTQIDEDPMEILGKLPQLRSLELLPESYIGKELLCHEFGFPQLQKLSLFNLSNLCWWRVDKGAIANLSSLLIWGCHKLEMIPDGLKHVAGLKYLSVQRMPTTFVDRIKVVDGREGEDFDKIRHIPSIEIAADYD
ncbi:hypothetical protein ACH5RR_031613 [Cinchona calisaya]|uniref:Disease resistance protein At1g50180 n=1 Tax=Cinchona calisaya TaxID=153742 RepID=A0ABD2YHP3_9GENT